MSDTRAFTYDIQPIGAGTDENNSVHETSPSWVLTFVSWIYRDTLRINLSQGATQDSYNLDALKAVNKPLVVINDCLSVTTTYNKGSYTPNMEATLVQTDINYLTAIAPGDFVLVNMLNWESDAEKIAFRAEQGSAINGINDGFKGVFKVQSVRKVVNTAPNGVKTVVFKITGFAFTEFNNMIYFDPSVTLQEPDIIFSKHLAENWFALINENKAVPIQKLVRVLTETFIGQGVSSNPEAKFIHDSQNNAFFMPASIGNLLGIPGVTAAKDIYNFILGIQQYGNNNANSIHSGFNPPKLQNTRGRFWEMPTGLECPGVSLLKAEYWNQVKTWDILNQYVNRPINEMFTCFRVDPQKDIVMPTVVMRQTPFSTEDFASANAEIKITRFLTLPRWRIDPALILAEDLGREEAARINYVQVFGKVLQGTDQGTDFTNETIRKNYVFEKNDIQRSGLRPTVVSSAFDIYPEGGASSYNSVTWAKILGDAMIGAHLRLNGNIICAGIVDPIAIGDNLEYDNIVYHIEQISHNCSIDRAGGTKSFRTTISLSQGVSLTSSSQYGTIYGQMRNPNAYAERIKDYKNNQILPGVAESQESLTRITNKNIDKTAPEEKPNIGFPQPKEIVLSPNPPKKKNKK